MAVEQRQSSLLRRKHLVMILTQFKLAKIKKTLMTHVNEKFKYWH